MKKQTENRFLKIIKKLGGDDDDDDQIHCSLSNVPPSSLSSSSSSLMTYIKFPKINVNLKTNQYEPDQTIPQPIEIETIDSENIIQSIFQKNESETDKKNRISNSLNDPSKPEFCLVDEILDEEIVIDGNNIDKDCNYDNDVDDDDDDNDKYRIKAKDSFRKLSSRKIFHKTQKHLKTSTKTNETNHYHYRLMAHKLNEKRNRKHPSYKSFYKDKQFLDEMTSCRLKVELQRVLENIEKAESLARKIENKLKILQNRKRNLQNVLKKDTTSKDDKRRHKFDERNKKWPTTNSFRQESFNLRPLPAHKHKYKMEFIVSEMSLKRRAHDNKIDLTGCTYLLCRR